MPIQRFVLDLELTKGADPLDVAARLSEQLGIPGAHFRPVPSPATKGWKDGGYVWADMGVGEQRYRVVMDDRELCIALVCADEGDEAECVPDFEAVLAMGS